MWHHEQFVCHHQTANPEVSSVRRAGRGPMCWSQRLMKKRTPRTDVGSAPTCTGSQPRKSYTTDQFRAVQESLQTCSQNPFQRVDGAILERLHKQHTRPNPLEDMEDALL